MSLWTYLAPAVVVYWRDNLSTDDKRQLHFPTILLLLSYLMRAIVSARVYERKSSTSSRWRFSAVGLIVENVYRHLRHVNYSFLSEEGSTAPYSTNQLDQISRGINSSGLSWKPPPPHVKMKCRQIKKTVFISRILRQRSTLVSM